MLDAICVGELLIDFTPEKAENTYRRNPGGAPANVAVAMAKAGCRVGFVGKVGNDDFGRFLQDTLRQEGVTILCEDGAEDAVTTMVFVNLDASGERSFTFVRKPGADMLLQCSDIPLDEIREARLVNAGSVSLSDEPARGATMFALQKAHEMKKLVCFDVNYRDMIWNGKKELARKCILDILPSVDLLKMSDEEVPLICGEEDPSALLDRYGIRAVVVSLGDAGARCYMKEGVREVATVKRACVDTTGAGDAFWGNTLACLLRSGISSAEEISMEDMIEGIHWGNAAGGYCVQRMGAIPSMPTLEETQQLKSGK